MSPSGSTRQMKKRRSVAAIFCFGVLSGISTTCILLLLFFLKQENHPGTWFEDLWRKSYKKLNYFVDVADNDERVPPRIKRNELTTDDLATKQITKYSYVQKGEEVAKELAKNVRVLCWVATLPKNHMSKASVIRDTWGRRCNVLLFMSSAEDSSLPAVKLNVSEGRNHLFHKTTEAMKYVYKYYLNEVDWILKADDDTFVIVENLRFILAQYNPSDPLYLGRRFKPFTRQGFMSGGAGYILSREGLKIFVEQGIGTNGKCLKMKRINENGEDVLLGRCLEVMNVRAVDTRDDRGRERFFPYSPAFHLFPDHSSPAFQWYWKYQYYPNPEGLDCCSDTAVSFHYISPKQLHILDYLVYTLHPYGTSLYNRNISSKTIKI